MKNFILSFLVFGLFFSIAPSVGIAASASPITSTAAKTLTKKELRKQKRSVKMVNFVKKRLEKKTAKMAEKRRGFSDWDRNIQLAAIFAAAAVVLSILWRATYTAGSIGVLGTLSSLAWLAALVFLVLWIIENV